MATTVIIVAVAMKVSLNNSRLTDWLCCNSVDEYGFDFPPLRRLVYMGVFGKSFTHDGR